ncbi:MAG: MFS transporter [Candidatus Solibacter sp.]|nr:MFS transporter [Candidatus Solibacter sp.]
MQPHDAPRRGFLSRLCGIGAAAADAQSAPPAASTTAPAANRGGLAGLPFARQGKRKRISSGDPTGGNGDRVRVNAGETAILAEIDGAGSIRHIWMTIADTEPNYGWGICAVGCGLVKTFTQFEVMRFVLGVAESGVYPAALVLLTHWFPRQERARANAYWNLCVPLSVAFSAPITGWLIGIWGWRTMIMLEGALPFHAQWRRNNPTRASVDLSDGALDFG